MYLDEQFSFTGVHERGWQFHLDGKSGYVLFEVGKAASAVPGGVGRSCPLLLIFLVGLTPCAIPWPPWSNHFSLRTMLIATTLIAVVMGLGVWLGR